LNTISALDGLFWLLISLLVLIILQGVLHREIQAFFLLITRRPGVTQVIFALIFFPGVLLHEFSHFLAARMLGVPTGKLSIFPQPLPNGRLRLGYVETASTGHIRDTLIGAAPLVSGCAFVALTAIFALGLLPLWDLIRAGDWVAFRDALASIAKAPDFWLWFYLIFVVSSTMLPSASDRHAWLPVFLLTASLIAVALLAGAGPWLLEHLAPPINSFLRALAMIFGLSALLHAFLILPFLLLHRLLAKLTGMDVQ
jgi:hypothetical protein